MRKAISLFVLIGLLAITNLQSQDFTIKKNETNSKQYSLMAFSTQTYNSDYSLLNNTTRQVKPRLRNTGILFTCMGVIFIAGGISMVRSANGVTYYSSQTYNGYTTTEGDATGAFGALGIVGGSLALIGGGTMWYFGQKKLSKGGRRTSFIFSPNSVYFAYNF